MGRMQIVFPDYVEKWLRESALKKGDISEMVTEAVVNHFKISNDKAENV